MTAEVTVAGYVVLVFAAAALGLAARSKKVMPFGDALDTALRRWPLRLALQAGWLWLGWHVFVRVHWR